MSESDKPEYSAEQKNQRHTVRAPLIVEKVPIKDGYKTFFGYANNVSRGGLFIATVKPREPGERFHIELTLPTEPEHTIRSQCEVIWKRHYDKKGPLEPGMGLKFVDISESDGDKIDAWVGAQVEQLGG